MFKFFKEKIKGWLKKSEKKVEETAEKKEIKEKPKKEKKSIKETEKREIKKTRGETPKEEKQAVKTKEQKQRTAPTFQELEKQKQEKKPTIFKKIKDRFSYKINEQSFEQIFSSLELLLLENNVALEAVEAIKQQIKEQLVGKEIKKQNLEQEIQKALKNAISNLLLEPDDLIPLVKEKSPFVMVFFGINGTGKTTTIAKVTKLLQKNNLSCVFAASDTFRAASIEQLQHHAENLKTKIIKHDYGADPAAVAFDAIKYAKNHKIDVVLIDTAGRMHTSNNLLSEMEKISKVTDPDLKIFVAESIAGNDAIEQARTFNEKIGIDASILTKADVDEKGGTTISISYITKKPILFLGIGQNYEDLELFDKEKFIKKLGLG
jgi:fused signal recognition particle receptor